TTINDIDYIHEETSSQFLCQSKQARRSVKIKLLGRCEVVCSQGEPLDNTSEGQIPIKPPSEDSNEEKWVRLVATQYSFLNQYLRERLKEKMKEGIENSESDTSDEEQLPSISGGRTHSMKMTEGKKKRDGKDAHVHSRLPLVRRKEDVKEQADWHHTQLNELLRNDIKELMKEQLATGHARMRKLLRKDLEEIRGLLKKELRQIFMEKMALLQEQRTSLEQIK
uniref:Uncharacterized protein n=1 Tax=Peromyscus maniculatus bairdii TaxID=230844 RepID=A0A8C8UC77_PERMB